MLPLLRSSFTVAILTVMGVACCAQEAAKLLFEDDFERNELQEVKEEPGGDWRTNSRKRAGGNKQVDLRDGTLFISRHATADHAVSLVHPAEYRDCCVHLRFRLDHQRDDLGIDFADMQCEEVHAGHICKIFFRPDGIEFLDFKNGRMNKAYRDSLKGAKPTEAQKASLAKWEKKIEHEIALGTWHHAVVTISGATMSVELDGEMVGSFTSAGMSHPRKDMIRFSARREAHLDDVKMFAFGPALTSSQPNADVSVRHLFAAKM